MANKKQILDFAFNEAVNTLNPNSMIDEKLLFAALETAMNGYAAREGYEFTPEEVKATIVAGLETLKKSGVDFKFQTWTMR